MRKWNTKIATLRNVSGDGLDRDLRNSAQARDFDPMATEEFLRPEADQPNQETLPLLQTAVGDGDSPHCNYRSINRPNESLNYANQSTRSVDSRWTLRTVPSQVTLDEQQLLQLSEAVRMVQDIIFAAQQSSSVTHRRR